MNGASSADAIWTVGHSSRSVEQFLQLLQTHSIERVADVRRFPGSRKYPHFNADTMCAWLAEQDIDYLPFAELGGRRKARPDSPHTVWRLEAFRGYADFMDTKEFGASLQRLIEAARERRTSLLCSEAVWWRCHRSMIADELKSRGLKVLHIMAPAKASEHPYTSAARIVDGRLYYGAQPD